MPEITPELNQAIDCNQVFQINCPFPVYGFAQPSELTPAIDQHYQFDPDVTVALLAGFAFNMRVMVQGLHGTGKSTHIEQIAARLNWGCMRVNLDGHITRLDLVGKDTIKIQDGKQITAFQEGILPWALQRPVALIFDEYDAGRPDVMFLIQRILERNGQFTMLDQNKVINPHEHFRLFATTNTLGLGDTQNLYHGTQRLNQAQIDRWNMVTTLNRIKPETEINIIYAHIPSLNHPDKKAMVAQMVALANLTRQGFEVGEVSTLMSPRTVLSWAQNYMIFHDVARAFRLAYLNKCDNSEKIIVAEYYQRCFDADVYG